MRQSGPLIIASNADPASLNIANNLIQIHGFEQQEPIAKSKVYRKRNIGLVIIEKECIYAQPKDIPIDSVSVIFASKHRSSTETPALTVHATGNLTREASYGGNPEEVSMVEPYRIYAALRALSREVQQEKLQIEVTMEATHHGPTNFPVPVCFIEIGSRPSEWESSTLGKIAAEAIVQAATFMPSKGTNAVGFGGTHYPAKHTRLCEDGTHLIGHIVSRHALDSQLSDQVLSDTFKKTAGGCKTAVVDWKGLKGEQRRQLLDKLSTWNVEIVRI